MKKNIFYISYVIIFFFNISLFGQSQLLQSGPMNAYSTMREVLLWVQTKSEAKVQFKYWNTNDPAKKIETETVVTSKEKTFVAQIPVGLLEPAQKYEYELYINDKLVKRPYKLKFDTLPLWKWRGDAPDFSFITGSCAYINDTPYDRPGKPYGSDYQIFDKMAQTDAGFMLWLGDNLYLREADWDSKMGIEYRFTHAHSLPELQPLWGGKHHFFIWDDHDYGNNNSDSSFPMKTTTQEVFRNFYPNPTYIFDEGNVSFFQWADCDFFLLDNRTWRSPDNRTDLSNPTILGEKQLQWLLDALSNSTASFKFIVMGGQFINPLKIEETYENIAPQEKAYLIESIRKLKIGGVLFLTGDVHHTELSKYDITPTYPLYDLTVSPLTSGVSRYMSKLNPLQVENTLVEEHNFAKIDVKGPLSDRKLIITVINSEGAEKWKKEISSNDLKF